jgi:hypothetical protein
METKEIAMVRRKALLGTAFLAAVALGAGPAAADTLQGFAGFADATYTHSTFSGSGSRDDNTATLGVGMALPVADIPDLNWEVNASYGHEWTEDYTHFSPNFCDPPATSGPSCGSDFSDSAEVWNFGFSPFLAYGGSRWGLNLNYLTLTHFGHITNGGGFFEWYLSDVITIAAKGGYLSTGGTPFGGHGHYLAGSATFYALPVLAVTGAVDWTDVVTNGQGVGCLHCQLDVSGVTYSIEGEWQPLPDWGFAVYGGFAYDQHTDYTIGTNESIWKIGVRYYTGPGTLIEYHRNGTLRSWLLGS